MTHRLLAPDTAYLQQPHAKVFLAQLRELGPLTLARPTRSELLEQARQHEIYISLPGLPSGEFPTQELSTNPGCLEYIACVHGGVSGVVNEELLRRGVKVTNWHDTTAVSIGGLAFTLLLALLEEIHARVDLVESGGWRFEADDYKDWPSYSHIDRVYGGTVEGLRVGIYGLGHAGRKFADYANAFDMTVRAFDPYVESFPPHVARANSLNDLVRDIDALVVMAALTPDTKGSITSKHLAQLPDGGIVVNVARGAIVDQDALFTELMQGRLRAGLDVLIPDYLAPEHPVRQLKNCLLTSHFRPKNRFNPPRLERKEVVCLDNIRRFLSGRDLLSPITIDKLRTMS